MTTAVDRRRARLEERELSALDAEKLLGIPRATVRSWAYRHRATGLHPISYDRRGVPLYLARDLIDIRHGKKIRNAEGERIRRSS